MEKPAPLSEAEKQALDLKTKRQKYRDLIYGLNEVGLAVRYPRKTILYATPPAMYTDFDGENPAIVNFQNVFDELKYCDEIARSLPAMRLRDRIRAITKLTLWELRGMEAIAIDRAMGREAMVGEYLVRSLRRCRQLCGLRFLQLAAELAVWFESLPPLTTPDGTEIEQEPVDPPGKRRIKPKPETEQILKLLDEGLDNNAISDRIGNSDANTAENICQVRSRWSRGMYDWPKS